MNPYSLLTNGAHLNTGNDLHHDDMPTRERIPGALDDLLARSALNSVNMVERLARRMMRRG